MSFSISILGGVGEIGMNMFVYETEKTAVIVDCGVQFADYTSPGIDYIIPDFKYLDKIKHKLKGLVLTHGHEDHVGAVHLLLQKIPLPVYSGKLTLGILTNKLTGGMNISLNSVEPREVIEIGDMKFKFIPVTHSIADTFAILVSSDNFSTLHCSDYKIDQTPVSGEPFNPKDFTDIGHEGLNCLLLDSTNVINEGFTKSELSVRDDLTGIFKNHKGRIFFTSFSSNIDRFRQVIDIAQLCGRKIIIEGASLDRNIEIAKKLNYLDLPNNLVLTSKKAASMPDHRLCYIITGSQGEVNSTLYKVASKERKDLHVKQGDLFIISARVIPGNEKALNNLVNQIYLNGGQVVDIAKKRIHVSGHASAEESRMVLNMTRPDYFIPVHGEPVHLHAHKTLADVTGFVKEKTLLVYDGKKVTFEDKKLKKIDEIPFGKIFVDLRGGFQLDEENLRERKHLCRDGTLSIALCLKNKQPAQPPTVKPVGFDMTDEEIFEIRKHLSDNLDILISEYGGAKAILEDHLSKLARSFIKKRFDRRPMVTSIILEV